jgi:hypothetical protein
VRFLAIFFAQTFFGSKFSIKTNHTVFLLIVSSTAIVLTAYKQLACLRWYGTKQRDDNALSEHTVARIVATI